MAVQMRFDGESVLFHDDRLSIAVAVNDFSAFTVNCSPNENQIS